MPGKSSSGKSKSDVRAMDVPTTVVPQHAKGWNQTRMIILALSTAVYLILGVCRRADDEKLAQEAQAQEKQARKERKELLRFTQRAIRRRGMGR